MKEPYYSWNPPIRPTLTAVGKNYIDDYLHNFDDDNDDDNHDSPTPSGNDAGDSPTATGWNSVHCVGIPLAFCLIAWNWHPTH